MTSLHESTLHCQIINAFMEDMRHYIRFNETKSGWKVCHTSGLCQNLRNYAEEVHGFRRVDTWAVSHILFTIFFRDQDSSPDYPFGSYPRSMHDENRLEYNEECRSDTVYLNPKRLTFIQNWKKLVYMDFTAHADWKPL